MTNESFENAMLELRRGVIVLAVLSNLDQSNMDIRSSTA